MRMLQVDPDERNEIDSALKKISREINNATNRFLDVLDMGESVNEGLHGIWLLIKYRH